MSSPTNVTVDQDTTGSVVNIRATATVSMAGRATQPAPAPGAAVAHRTMDLAASPPAPAYVRTVDRVMRTATVVTSVPVVRRITERIASTGTRA